MKTVKIGMAEYRAMKALASKRGQLLQFILNEAVKQYLAANSQKESQAA